MTEPSKFIRYGEVLRRVGAAAFKDEYIRALSWRERWLLEVTGLLDADDESSSGFVGGNYQQPRGPFAHLPELLATRAKQAFMLWQHNWISDWVDMRQIEVIEHDRYDEVDRAQFEAAFLKAFPGLAMAGASARQESAGTAMFEPERRQRGRPPKWDWDGAKAAYAAHLGNDPDGLPKRQADAERWVADWFSQSSDGNAPPITEIRARVVTPIYEASRMVGISKK